MPNYIIEESLKNKKRLKVKTIMLNIYPTQKKLVKTGLPLCINSSVLYIESAQIIAIYGSMIA